jgi:hypothetical protein
MWSPPGKPQCKRAPSGSTPSSRPFATSATADRERLYLHAARLIEATYAITARERHDAVRYVADRLVPLT